MTKNETREIAIAGAGYAGLHEALRLATRLGDTRGERTVGHHVLPAQQPHGHSRRVAVQRHR